MRKPLALTALFTIMCGPACADSIGVRGALADTMSKEDFEAYELFIVFDLPWARNTAASVVQTQLEITGGVLDAAGESGLLATLGPRVAVVTDRFSVDAGVGVAALGRTEFGAHDFGGRSQFIAQAGLSLALTRRFNAGVRFRHMSDADIHDARADLNLVLLELSYDYFERR